VCFNVGYHNEHHDIVTIPWCRLPQVRRIAPEFYEGLHAYTSWTALLVRFVRDPDITLFNTIVRPAKEKIAPQSSTLRLDPDHADERGAM
jgi:sphingolipid delta-4 desaturase